MNQLFTFFHGITKKSRVNTIVTNNRLSRTPVRRIPIPEDINTRELNRVFLQGWRACERGEEIYNNPIVNVENQIYSPHNAWERGYFECYNTRRTNPYVAQTREYITDMFHNDAQTHGFCVGAQNTQLELIYNGDMDELSVRAMIDELKYRYRNYIFNEQVLGFMEDFLNEHLSGTSTIRLV